MLPGEAERDAAVAALLDGVSCDKVAEVYKAVRLDSGDLGRRSLCRVDRFYLLTCELSRPDAADPWLFERCREVEASPDGHLDLWAREHYKPLRLDEPIPTPTGWTTQGELWPGDELFGPDGAVCRVLALNKVVTDADCYEIEFDDGTKIQAGGEHLWPVERKTRKRVPSTWAPGESGKRKYRETVLMSTRDIAAWPHESDNRLCLRVNDPLQLPDVGLPIDPYVLGAWLGDGTTGQPDITGADPEIFAEIEARGFRLGKPRTKPGNRAVNRRMLGCVQAWRDLGVLNNKHIPQAYLRASAPQRLDLLRGLMDADGHCNTRGTATFCNTNQRLVSDVYELAVTLGMRPMRRLHTAEYLGAPYSHWQVSFQAYEDACPFLLPRKAKRCKPGSRLARHFIVACRPAPSVPMRCIQVDREDGLYLAGRQMVPTHNSTIITFAGSIQEILKDPDITIGIFSHTKPVAQKFMRQIKEELERNKRLQALFPDILYERPDLDSPRWSDEKGIVVRRSSNPKEATLEAHGLVDGQPIGAHFLLRIYDDVVTDRSVSTPEQVEKTTNAWALSDNLGARGPDGRMRAWHVGTRYSFADSYQFILDQGLLKARIYPATDDGTFEGKPVFLNDEAWAEKLKMPRAITAAQQLQNPASGTQAMFKKEWLKFIDVRPGTLNVYIMCDPASSRKKGSDYTAIVALGIDVSGNMYLLDGYRHKMGLLERWMRLKELRTKWMREPGVQMVRVGYERFGLNDALEFFEERMRVEKEAFEIVELAWPNEGPGSKSDRVQRLEPAWRLGKIHLAAAVTRTDEKGVVHQAETAAQRRMRESGQAHRIFTPVKKIDPNSGATYSINKVLLDEYLTFPFSQTKDFIDAMSRIYDMEPRPPVIVDNASLEPEAFADGA